MELRGTIIFCNEPLSTVEGIFESLGKTDIFSVATLVRLNLYGNSEERKIRADYCEAVETFGTADCSDCVFEDNRFSDGRGQTKRKAISTDVSTKKQNQSIVSKSYRTMSIRDPECIELIQFIKDEFLNVEDIDTIRFYEKTVMLSGAHNHYCERIGRPHRSNRVYYVLFIENGDIVQKCLDADCSNYASHVRKYERDLTELLQSIET